MFLPLAETAMSEAEAYTAATETVQFDNVLL